MPARQASSCAASSGWAASSSVPVRGLAGLEIGHVAVQDADERRGGVRRRNRLRLAIAVARPGWSIVVVVGLGHLRRSPAGLGSREGPMSLPIIIGPRETRMSRTFPTVLGGCHPVPVGDDHRFGPESDVFGLVEEQGGAGGSPEKKARDPALDRREPPLCRPWS